LLTGDPDNQKSHHQAEESSRCFLGGHKKLILLEPKFQELVAFYASPQRRDRRLAPPVVRSIDSEWQSHWLFYHHDANEKPLFPWFSGSSVGRDDFSVPVDV
jgi:hypothetical protein